MSARALRDECNPRAQGVVLSGRGIRCRWAIPVGLAFNGRPVTNSLGNVIAAPRCQADAAFLEFVHEHRDADVTRLLLGKAPTGIDLRAAADQILARQKSRTKLPDWHGASDLVFPPPVSVEQASSRITADYKASLVEGPCIVDLSGGMGVDMLALARRFERAIYVERDPELCRRFAHNSALLADRSIEVVNASADQYVESFAGTATFFVDPARRDEVRNRIYRLEDCSPNVVALLPRLRARADRVLVKASPMTDLAEGLRQLQPVREVHVVSVANECREVLFLIDFAFEGEPDICCVNFRGSRAPEMFRFDFAAERSAAAGIADAGRYLYDPNTSIRKAGAFRTIAVAFGLARLAPSTHLYTSNDLIPGFPGRVFESEGEPVKDLRRMLPDGRANVVSRNHPMSADQLRARFRLKDGGDRYLIGYRDDHGRARLVVARRVDP